MVITISLSVGCMCCPSIPLHSVLDKPSCLGEMGEGARLRRPSHNHSSVLQSLKSSEAARNVKKKKKRCLYEDAEFNVRAEDEDDKTASEYKQADCLGTYDTLSEIGKRKREFVCRGAKFKLRSIILRTCTFEVISHLYRNKLDVAQREGRGPGDEGPSGRSGRASPPPHQGPGAEPLSGGCSAARRGTIKCSFTAAPQAKSALSVYFR